MAGIDWLTALGVSDQSLESQLARRDLSKKAQLVQNLFGMQEKQRSDQAQEAFRNKQLEEQTLLRKATMDASAQQREWQNKQNAEKARLSQYNITSDNLQRQVAGGVAPAVNPEQAQLLTENEGPGVITDKQTAGSPPGEGNDAEMQFEHLYRQHEAEQAAATHKLQEGIRKAQEARAVEDQKFQQHDQLLRDKADKRAEDTAKRAGDREKRLQAAADAKTKAADAAAKKLPPALYPGVKKRAEQIIAENSSVWDSLDPWTKQENVADAWVQATQEMAKKAQDAGLMPLTPSLQGGGRGGGSGAGGGPKETPEQRIQRILGGG